MLTRGGQPILHEYIKRISSHPRRAGGRACYRLIVWGLDSTANSGMRDARRHWEAATHSPSLHRNRCLVGLLDNKGSGVDGGLLGGGDVDVLQHASFISIVVHISTLGMQIP